MLNDLRYGLRGLLQARGWTTVVVLSLALGIGANTALFSGVSALLLRQIPVRDPGSLVRLRYTYERSNDMWAGTTDYGQSDAPAGRNVRPTVSYRMFNALRAANRTLADMAACAPLMRINVVADGAGALSQGFVSTGNYYDLLGARAALGRTIGPADDTPASDPVAVISHQYWQSRFGGDPGVIGKVVSVANVGVTIVGVLEPGFTGVQSTTARPPDIAFPLALDARLTPQRGGAPQRLAHPARAWLQVIGRLKPGATAQQVQSNLGEVFQREARAGLDEYLAMLPEGERFNARNRNRTEVPRLVVDSAARGVYRAARSDLRSVRLLGVVVLLVLLIVCANVANMLLARSAARAKEVSIRLSAGATRGRVVRQMLTESVLLAFIGGGVGILVANWGTALLPGALGTAGELDWRVLTFTLVVTTSVGLAFGLAPALRATRVDVSSALKENGRTMASSRTLLGKGLVVAQIALTLFLLVSAGLLVRTMYNLRHTEVGFDPENLVLFEVDPRFIQYEPSRFARLYQRIADRVRAVPGVRAVTFSENGLLTGAESSIDIFIQGSDGGRQAINRLIVSPNFFETMGMPLVAGRLFEADEARVLPRAVVINETASREFFAGGSPLGRSFGTSDEQRAEFEVVGVLRDAKYSSMRETAPPTMYLPYSDDQPRSVVFEARTVGNPADLMPGIREAVRHVQPDLPLANFTTQTEEIEGRLERERSLAQAYAGFGALALSVAAVGLFGLMSYSVTRRTREMGIRLAVGAGARDVLWMVMRDSIALVAAGVCLGLAGVAAAGGLFASMLYGVAPTDAVTMAAALTVMLGVTLLAGYLPARRASRVDPVTALRYE